jgi:DNA primase large subunit
MQELYTLARYPFLDAAKSYIKEEGPTVDELLTDILYERARTIGIERLDRGFNNRDIGDRSLASESDCIMELLSYPLARMIAVCVADPYFKRRYALGEAVHAYKNLLKSPVSFLLNVANEFSIHAEQVPESNKISIYFKDYLRYAPTRYKEWKMINREMSKGFLSITQKDLARIILEALRSRINTELDALECNKAIFSTFSSDIKRFQNTVMLHRKKIETAPIGKLSIEKLPPCLKHILSAIQQGENVPHMGRFALVAFLNSIQLNTNEILKLFSTAPDYEEDKTRYQVEHITGSTSATSYKAPGCDKMRTYGLCPTDEIDDLCKKIKHPRSYYNAQWKKGAAKT